MLDESNSKLQAHPFAAVANDLIAQVFFELHRVKDDPRLLVIVTHGLIELFIHTLVMKKCKNASRIKQNGRDFSHSAKLIILNELGVLHDDTFHVLDWFRRLRNEAAHEPLFALTAEDLSRLEDVSFQDLANFLRLCQSIIGDVWADHLAIIAIEFAPNLVKAIEPLIPKPRPFSIREAILNAPSQHEVESVSSPVAPAPPRKRVRIVESR